MCSNAWPNEAAFWDLLFVNSEGRLGLFHHMQRMTNTLKKRHIDHHVAITRLANCICHCNVTDHDNLLKTSKEGTLPGVKHSDLEINDLKNTRMFKQRCDKCMQKEMTPLHTMTNMLGDWFDAFKCMSSDEECRPAKGRKDPIADETLFTSETKEAISECKKRLLICRIPHLWIRCMM